MKTVHIAGAAVCFVLLAGVVSAQAPVAQGHWEGNIDVPGQPLAIVVDLGKKGDAWNGTISIPAQHVTALPLSGIAMKDDDISFSMKGVPGDPSFKGKVATQSRTIAGDFTQSGMTMPFALSWKGEPRFEPPPKSTRITADVQGSWSGTLTVGATQLRLVLELSNGDEAAHGQIVSLDQGAAEIPITQIVQDGAKLTFMVSTIGARYEGEVRAGKIDGTWTQSAQSFPLAFGRQQ